MQRVFLEGILLDKKVSAHLSIQPVCYFFIDFIDFYWLFLIDFVFIFLLFLGVLSAESETDFSTY